jgi:hypothetical protein
MYRFLSGTFQMKYVMEYQAISFQSPAAVWLEAMMLLGAVAAAWSLYKKRFAYVILLVGWIHLGLIATRNIPIFMIVAAPIVGLTLNEFLLLLKNANVAGWLRQTAAAVEEIADEVNATDRWTRVHLSSALPVLILAVLLYSPAAAPGLRAEYDAKKYPAKALEVLRGPEFANSIFTHDEWGDYLIYRLYPNTKVFVDGRCDFYGAKFEEKFVDVMNVKYGWQKILRQYGVDTVLLPVDAPLAGALKESRRWRATYDDGIAIVFRSAGPEAEMPSRLSKTESEQASVVACNSRNNRDRKVTKSENRDPRITKSNTRSEPL